MEQSAGRARGGRSGCRFRSSIEGISVKSEYLTQSLRERRRSVRVPMSSMVEWRCGRRTGHCLLLNISPHGASFLAPHGEVLHIGPDIVLDVPLDGSLQWRIADRAHVLRRTPRDYQSCEIAVRFDHV